MIKEILFEIKKIKSTRKDLRNFGIIVGIGAFILGALFHILHKPGVIYLLSLSFILILSGFIIPIILIPFQKIWMSFAIVVGWIVSHIILILFFYLIITPIGLLARTFNRDFFQTKINRSATSYWIKRESGPRGKETYERQF